MNVKTRIGRLLTGLAIPAALLCAVPAAHADTATITSQNSTLTISPTTGEPGSPVTITITITPGPNDHQASLDFTDSRSPDPFYGGICESNVIPSSCDDQGGISLTYGPGLLYSGITTAVITTTVPPDATPGTHIFTSAGSFVGATQQNYTPGSLAFTVTAPAADVAVGLTATAPPLLSSYIDYTTTATDNGPDAASNATLVTQLPTQTTSVTGLPSGCTYTSTTDQVTCITGTIGNGNTVRDTFRAHLGLLAIGLPLNATVTRTASTPTDLNPATTGCTVITSLIITC